MNIQQALALHSQIQSDTSRLDAELLLAQVLDKGRTYLMAFPERSLTGAQQSHYEALLARRIKGEPVAFILGKKGFWTLDLAVEPATLIPRPDTELLVEAALECLRPERPARVLDLGTGTGAIALAIASERRQAEVVAVDYSEQAVALARRNAEANGLSNVQVLQSDWFAAVAGRFDVIVSNPPYIAGDDPHLARGDVRFEPASALVAPEQGLADIKNIIRSAPDYLTPGGALWLEHGWQQAEEVSALLQAAGFVQVQTRQDLAGNDRISGGVVLTTEA